MLAAVALAMVAALEPGGGSAGAAGPAAGLTVGLTPAVVAGLAAPAALAVIEAQGWRWWSGGGSARRCWLKQ